MEALYNKLMTLIADYEFQYRDVINKSFNYALKYHAGQTRQSGDDYIIHPLNVAITLAEMKADAETICAGLLHDTIEDTKLTKETIVAEFGEEVANLVEGVTNISNTNFSSPIAEKAANDRRIVLSMTEDIRIVIIKLADRLHNMRTLDFKKESKRVETSYETMDIFAPLANYIGAHILKSELEDLSMKYLREDDYYSIKKELEELYARYYPKLKETADNIHEHLNKNGIDNTVSIGVKSIYGVYRRKKIYQLTEFIPDLFQLKIAIDNAKNSYVAIGLISEIYPPNESLLEDYISRPKHNTYKSIHTTFVIDKDLFVQGQIRTKDMDLIASYGLTAYWRLNPTNTRERMQKDLREKFQFFHSIKEIDNTFQDNTGFLIEIRRQLLQNKIRITSINKKVFTALEEKKIIDFINSLDSNLLDAISSISLNGMPAKITDELKEGDQLTIRIKGDIPSHLTDYRGLIIPSHTKVYKKNDK